jgi:HAD superfamily hydrolase (TIGR01509 family)
MGEWESAIGTYETQFDPWITLQELARGGLDGAAILPAREQRELELIAQQPVLPGVRQYLQEARQMGLKLGVASSSQRRWVDGYLESLGLKAFFDCVRCKEDVRVTKPDPALYLAVLNGLGIAPRQAIALEDSPNGILAARQAGLFCVAVPTPLTRSLDLNLANLVVNSLEDLPLKTLIELVQR